MMQETIHIRIHVERTVDMRIIRTSIVIMDRIVTAIDAPKQSIHRILSTAIIYQEPHAIIHLVHIFTSYLVPVMFIMIRAILVEKRPLFTQRVVIQTAIIMMKMETESIIPPV